jgi:hypothetical protein
LFGCSEISSDEEQKTGPDESFELVRAWKLVLENHFHDTICTTSVPQVLIEARVRADKAIQIAEAISSQAIALLMSNVVPVSKERMFIFNPTNIARMRELVVVWMAMPRGKIIDAGQILTVTDCVTGKSFNSTVLSFESSLWCYRHKKGGFRSGHSFNMLKIAMRPPVVEANEMRLFHISQNPEYGPAETSSTIKETEHQRRRSKTTTTTTTETTEEATTPLQIVGEFGNSLMKCKILRDGSLVVSSKHGFFADEQRVNVVSVQQDSGTQYLASFGNQISPIRMEKLRIVRNAEFEHVSFRLRGYDLTVQVDEFQERLADKNKKKQKMTFDIGVNYVLAEGSSQIMTRISLNNPEGSNRNFALRVGHFTSCKKKTKTIFFFKKT